MRFWHFINYLRNSNDAKFSKISFTYAQNLAQYETDGILMNIISASEERPLSFLDIPSINGSGNISTSPSIGGTLVASNPGNLIGNISNLSPSLGLSFGTSFNFTQSSLDNATFWKGILTPIPLKFAKYFRTNRIPKELLFTLLIDSIDFKKPDGTVTTVFNSPLREGGQDFQKILYKLIDDGLEIELADIETNLGDIKTEDELIASYGVTYVNTLLSQGVELKPIGLKADKKFQMISRTQDFKLCLSSEVHKKGAEENFNHNVYCKISSASSSDKITGDDEVSFELSFNVRSPKNIFDFLGEVVLTENQKTPYLLTLPPTKNTFNKKMGESRQYALLVVNKNNLQVPNFASVSNLENETYSIPKDNNGYTTLVFDILTQIVTLNKVSGTIPAQPAVLLK